jgi:gluconolactonase
MRSLAIFALLAASLAAEDPNTIKVERVSSNHRFLDGVAWSHDGFLLFNDVPNNRIYKMGSKGMDVFREKSGGASGNAFDDRGRLVTCESGNRRVTRTNAKGEVEVLADKFEGKRLNAPNDIAIRKDGHIYFTDPAFGQAADQKDLPFYGVFHITPKGELSVVSRLEKRPNGITLSPNGKLLYVTGADERVVRVYDLDRQGNASPDRVLITGITGVPGGIRTDDKGNLYVACESIAIYSPDGRPLRNISLPEPATNLAFGDGDLQTLYITTRTTLLRVRLDAKGGVQEQ